MNLIPLYQALTVLSATCAASSSANAALINRTPGSRLSILATLNTSNLSNVSASTNNSAAQLTLGNTHASNVPTVGTTEASLGRRTERVVLLGDSSSVAPSKGNGTLKAKVWKNGDVLCKNSSTCGKHGVCEGSPHTQYDKKVCLCSRTYLAMTVELKCPGKPLAENDPWEPVECTSNASLCGSQARCLGTHWGSEYKNRSFCFCRHTMEPMRTNFACLPLSRFAEQKRPKYTPIDCTHAGIRVCGEEAVCERSPQNASIKICVCPQTNEPVGGPGLSCPRTVVARHESYASLTLSTGRAEALQSKSAETHPAPFWSSLRNGSSLSILLPLIMLVSVISGLLYCRSCSRKENIDKVRAMRLQCLQQQRYISNPHYYETDARASPESIPLLPPVHLIERSMIFDLQEIGEGYFAKVYKGCLRSEDDGGETVKTVAVKMLKRATDQEAMEDFMREVEITSTFRHENILGLTGFCARDERYGPWMVFEYMPFGDLTTVLRNSNHPWLNLPGLPNMSSLETLLVTAQQIANGMKYLAERRFVHRDLACRNCLVGSGLIVKIADFGMSRDINTCDYYRIGGTRLLPVRWMSPESISYGKFTFESDIWSFGVVLWEIFSYGKQPYFGHTNEEVLRFILNGKFLVVPERCPDGVSEIMKACWKVDPTERMSFEEISHRFEQLTKNLQEQSNVRSSSPVQPETIEHSGSETRADVMDEDNYLKPIQPNRGEEELLILDSPAKSESQESDEDNDGEPHPAVALPLPLDYGHDHLMSFSPLPKRAEH